MTRAQLERYFRLKFELEERGRLDPTDSSETPRLDEYENWATVFDRTFTEWEEQLVIPEPLEVRLYWDTLLRQSENYQASLRASTEQWEGLCRYWHEEALRLRRQLRGSVVEFVQEEENPDAE